MEELRLNNHKYLLFIDLFDFYRDGFIDIYTSFSIYEIHVGVSTSLKISHSQIIINLLLIKKLCA